MRSFFGHFWKVLCALCLITSSAVAQADGIYPNRAINLIVPWPAGGSVDFVARIVATQLSTELQQPVVIDNKPGAAGNIGAAAGARAKADGYTLVVASPPMAMASSLYRKLSYDLIKDFVPVSRLGEAPYVLVVKPAFAATAMELVTRAKANPGKLTFASAGAGSQPHLIGEAFKKNASIDILHVPYKGAPQAVTDLIGGSVDMAFNAAPSVIPMLKVGQIKALAVTSRARSRAFPDVPTLSEAGIPGIEGTQWAGILAPAGTPKEIVVRLNSAIVKSMSAPGIRELMISNGYELITSTPEQFGKFVAGEQSKWAAAIKQSGTPMLD